jgi:hypothetical protein
MENNSHIQFCVTYSLINKKREELMAIANIPQKGVGNIEFEKISSYIRTLPETKDEYRNFENEIDAQNFYNKILKHEDLYTANFCKIIKTTE